MKKLSSIDKIKCAEEKQRRLEFSLRPRSVDGKFDGYVYPLTFRGVKFQVSLD